MLQGNAVSRWAYLSWRGAPGTAPHWPHHEVTPWEPGQVDGYARKRKWGYNFYPLAALSSFKSIEAFQNRLVCFACPPNYHERAPDRKSADKNTRHTDPFSAR